MESTDRFGLVGTAAIVTGAGSGIGRACALLLADLGSAVCVIDLDADAAGRTVDTIVGQGGRAFSVHGDARDNATASEAARATLERYGRLDVLVNNVGGMFFAPATELTPGGWSSVVRLNLDTTFSFSQAVAPAMLAAGKGTIVNIASTVGLTGLPRGAHYAAAKAGIINLTRSLAVEWAPKIRVNCVAPDFVLTEGTERLTPQADRDQMAKVVPLGRLGLPEDIASAVAFLASDLASFVTGQTLVVDGGAIYRGHFDFAIAPPAEDS